MAGTAIEMQSPRAAVTSANSTTDSPRTTTPTTPHRSDGSILVDESPGDGSSAEPGCHEFSLPPVDRGKDAWLFLAACFLMEALVWGFPFSFGVFQDYYRTHDPFQGSSQIAVIGTCATGIMYFFIPVVMGFYRLFPRTSRYLPAVGLIIMVASLIGSSFSTTTAHLIATQGVLYAIGGTISYCPCLLYMNEWFVERQGLAFGVMWSGTGLGGLAAPLLLNFLLDRYGFRAALRIWSVVLFISIVPLVYFIKPRLPASAATRAKPFKLGFMLQRDIMFYQLSNVAEAIGFFLPSIYLPSFARTALGVGSLPAALTVLVLNVGSVIGCVGMGALIDRIDVSSCILISTVGAAVGVFLLWGFATNLAVLYVFCVVYGIFAGAYTSAWPGVMKDIKGSPSRGEQASGGAAAFDPTMLFGMLSAGRGLGNVVSGPLSEALIRGMPWQGQAAGAYGSGYGTLIAFTGTSAVAGGASYMFKRLGWL